LRDALESVLSQTYRELEILVVDDGSSDNTRELVASLPGDKIRYIRHERNWGCSAAYNTGISAASGQLVAFLDSDDFWKPDYLERQVGLMSRHPEVDAVFSDTEIRGELITPSLVGLLNVFPKLLESNNGVGDYVFTGRQIYLCLLEEVPIKPSAFLVKREVFERAGMFDEAWPSGTDWDLFLRISRLSWFGYTHQPLVVQRRSPDGVFDRYREQDKEFLLKVFTKEKRKLQNDPVALRAVNRGILDHCSDLGLLYQQSGRKQLSLAAYWCGFIETGEPIMLAKAASVFLPERARALARRAVRFCRSHEAQF
jgi:glycosyltransferase involved in cell wall biosynthesis